MRDIAARLRVHITDSAAVLRTTPLAVRLITADAIISLPSYLTTMFVQQRLVTLGWGASWLFVSPLLASAAAMVCTALARRLHPGKLRPLYRLCALVCGGGVLLAGAGPARGCLVGPMLVQASLSVWFLHAMQRFNDAIPSDRRATLISVDNMAYSVLMIPASPLIGLIADVTGLARGGTLRFGRVGAAFGPGAAAQKIIYDTSQLQLPVDKLPVPLSCPATGKNGRVQTVKQPRTTKRRFSP